MHLLSYIDPETVRHVFGGPLAPFIASLLAVLAFVFWPVRLLLGRLRDRNRDWSRPTRIAMVFAVALVAGGAMGIFGSFFFKKSPAAVAATVQHKPLYSKVIVLGMDGLDPQIIERMMAAGELPNLRKLASMGSYSRLQTSNPPESPVAWSTIATGSNPGEHGIFDFMHRDPNSYLPYLSLRKTTDGFLGTKYERPRRREGFWMYTSKASIPTTVIRWPVAFPAEQVTGRFLAGFGVPDLLGGEGRYTHFTSEPVSETDPSPRNVFRVNWKGATAAADLVGPSISSRRSAMASLTFEKAENALQLSINGDAPVVLKVGEWSSLLPVRFDVGVKQVQGRVKFFLSSLAPEVRLTASPIHLDASDPAMPLACPDCFGGELVDAIGPIHTLGMPEQIHPLSHARYDFDAFLAECRAISAERRKMLALELSRFDSGLLAFVFDTSDRIQHAFWATQDPAHPAYDKQVAEQYGNVIPDMYREMDDIAGEVMQKCDDQVLLIILSDHGFSSFRRAVHLNRWLVENGYMTLSASEGRELYRDVDWSKTKAFAVGFASIYLNVRGRESQGIVDPADVPALAAEIRAKLSEWRDPKTEESIIHRVYTAEELYRGAVASSAPDIVVGLKPGYRISWQTALGGVPASLIEDNVKRWSGDHLIDPSFVPGVLFSNGRLSTGAQLQDIAPTVLHAFGISCPEHMSGQSLLDGR